MTDINLRDLVRAELRSAPSVEYADLAAAVLAQIGPRDVRAALAQALPAFVRSVTVSQRTAGAVTPPQSGPSLLPRSWKVQEIREGWQRRMDEVYATEAGNKRLGDFTYADLTFQSELCQSQAKAKLAKAKGWRNLADLLESEGVAVVRDLPAEVLMTTLGAVA